ERGGPIFPHHAAYVIHTSGTTGTPKCVVVEHAGVVNLIDAYEAEFGADSVARVLGSISFAFDAHIEDTVLPLALGGCVELVDDLLALVERDAWHGSLLTTVPSALASILPAMTGELAVQRVHLGGEPLPGALLRDIHHRIPGCTVTNVYGPTETTIWSLAARIDDDNHARPPIGGPLDGSRVFVLDQGLQPVPVGVVGELYVSGAGVARGYVGAPGVTAGRFVACPFGGAGERMYRTGDLVRWTGGGGLEFVGRVDQQVKVRGFRVELGEVEGVMAGCDGVAQAVASVRDGRLLAHVVPGSGSTDRLAERVRERAVALLPDYMVPSVVMVLEDGLPLTPNGKLDRAALPAPQARPADTTRREPTTGTEGVLRELFAQILGVPEVGLDDSFFDLGGDSILSIRLVA
ncbi:non-ribosomal peptide synthetase, partial [Streptomyces sp. NPDC003832]